MSKQEIELWFPALVDEGYNPNLSPEDPAYNCFAWAGCEDFRKWDPDSTTARHWPEGVERKTDLDTFIKLYEIEGGYLPCGDNAELEEGFEKIALYWKYYADTKQIEVSHAARQLPNGHWTSKIGDCDDVEHFTLTGLCGSWYGTVAKILKRERRMGSG